MDPNLFQPDAPGSLVPVEAGETAFLPAPLPPVFEVTPTIYNLIADSRAAIGEIRGLTAPEIISDPGVLLRSLQRDESLRSSSLEGTHSSPDELLRYELRPVEPRSAADAANTQREVANHDEALRLGEQMIGAHGVSAWLIRSLHAALLKGVRGEDKAPGQFRTRQVYIGSDHRFVPPPPHLVQESMERLVDYWRAPPDVYPPLVRAAMFHYQFEAIHPFLDGNGRIGRLLYSLMLAGWCELGRPWLYLSAFFEDHKDEYVDGLMRVSTRGDWHGWVALCLRAVATQGRETASRIRALTALRKLWEQAAMAGSTKARTLKLIDALFATPITDTMRARAIMGVGYNTARRDLDALVRLGLLEPKPGSDPLVFYARDVIRIVHSRKPIAPTLPPTASAPPTPPTSP